MEKKFNSLKQSGFTLIEVIVVLVILGILASIVVPNVISRTDQAQIVKAKQDIRALESALQMYRVDNFSYPTTDQGLQALVEKPSSGPEAKNWQQGGYIKKVPLTPGKMNTNISAQVRKGILTCILSVPTVARVVQIPMQILATGNWTRR